MRDVVRRSGKSIPMSTLQAGGPRADGRIPTHEKLAISAANSTDWIASGSVFQSLLVPFFTIGLGLSPALLGLVQMVWRLWDAFSDPMVGWLSDSTRSRWGRRRPYIALGAVLVAGMYPFVWLPPGGLEGTGLALWLGAFGVVYYTCCTIWAMPYYALQMELTPDYEERTRLASWIMVVSQVIGIATAWLPWLIASDHFADPVTGEADIVAGMRAVSWPLAAFILVLALLPALCVRERFGSPLQSRVSKETVPFLQAMRESATCKPLWILIGVSFLFVFGGGAISMLGQFAAIYYVCEGDLALFGKVVGVKSTVMVVAGIASVPLWNLVARRLDKARALTLLMSIGVLGHLSNYVLMDPRAPYLLVVAGVLDSVPFSALWLLLPSMKADIADYDEARTGRRREGSLNSFYSWFFKAAITASAGVGGWVASASGYDPALTQQPPEVVRNIFHMFLAVPLAAWILAIALVAIYPLNREVMRGIRAQLDARAAGGGS